jgi:5-(carboxyamino)imidazole ribonucleotide mutase
MEREKHQEKEPEKPKLLIVTASRSDFEHLYELKKLLRSNGVRYDLSTISCHRDIDKFPNFVEEVLKKDYSVIIAVANSVSNLPAILGGALKDKGISVIGVGLGDKGLSGMDSLLSINTIPKGVPMANTGIGEVGLYNAGLCAIELIKNHDQRRST